MPQCLRFALYLDDEFGLSEKCWGRPVFTTAGRNLTVIELQGDLSPAILSGTAWDAYLRLLYDVKVEPPDSPAPDCPAIALPRVTSNQSGQWFERATPAISMRGRFSVRVCTVADHRATQKPSIIQTLLLMTPPRMAR
jgi:hypothetical protein